MVIVIIYIIAIYAQDVGQILKKPYDWINNEFINYKNKKTFLKYSNISKDKIYFLLKRHLQGWSNFVRAVKLCLEPEISEEQIDDVQKLLKNFSDYYER